MSFLFVGNHCLAEMSKIDIEKQGMKEDDQVQILSLSRSLPSLPAHVASERGEMKWGSDTGKPQMRKQEPDECKLKILCYRIVILFKKPIPFEFV